MGCSTPPSITDASITLGRDGDLQAPLTIDYTVGDFRGSTPGSVTFGAGQDAVTVSVATGADDYFLHFSFALVDGAGYDLGEPANVSVDGLYSTPSCPLPPTTEPPTGTRELPRTGSSEGLDVLALAGVMLLLAGFGLNRSATARRRATGPTT
jgi:LPXTG-motif cell wall-anchored protein